MTVAEARKNETLQTVVGNLKSYFQLLEKKGIPLTPPTLKVILLCPKWLMVLFFKGLLRFKAVTDTLLGNHAISIAHEIQKLDKIFPALV